MAGRLRGGVGVALLGAGCGLVAGCAEGGAPPAPACVDAPVPAAPPVSPWSLEVAPVSSEAVIASSLGAAPHVAWDGRGWTVAWGDRVLALDESGRPLARVQHALGSTSAIEAGTCLRAVATRAERGSTIAWLDEGGAIARAIEIEGTDTDLARGEARWWLASRLGDAIQVRAVDAMGVMEIEHIARAGTPRLAITPAGVTVAWADAEGIVVRTLARPGAQPSTSPRVTAANAWADGALELAALGDRVVLAAADGAMVHAAIVDPRTDSVAGPLAVARTTSRARPGIAAIPQHDLAAICYASGPGPNGGADVQDRVELIVVGGGGAPVAPAIELAGGGPSRGVVRAVSCAWSGREVLVAWWRTRDGGDELAVRRARVGRSAEIISEPW